MREIRLSGLRKHIEGVREDLDVKPEGIGRRQESSSEFSVDIRWPTVSMLVVSFE
jgi:hypothetical protein